MAVWSAMAGEMAVWDVRGGPTLDEVGSQSPSSNGEEVSSTAAAEAAAAEEWPRSVSRASTLNLIALFIAGVMLFNFLYSKGWWQKFCQPLLDWMLKVGAPLINAVSSVLLPAWQWWATNVYDFRCAPSLLPQRNGPATRRSASIPSPPDVVRSRAGILSSCLKTT